MAITSKGKEWETQKAGTLAILAFLGIDWLVFMIMAINTRQRKWAIAAIFYLLPVILAILVTPKGVFLNLTFIEHNSWYIYLGFYIVGFFHYAFSQEEYLVRLEALEYAGSLSNEDEKAKVLDVYNGKTPVGGPADTVPIDSILPENNAAEKTETEPTAEAVFKVDINISGPEEFAGLPGMNSILGKRAVELRETQGAFTSVEDFGERLGLQPHIIEKIRPQVMISPLETDVKSTHKPQSGRVIDY